MTITQNQFYNSCWSPPLMRSIISLVSISEYPVRMSVLVSIPDIQTRALREKEGNLFLLTEARGKTMVVFSSGAQLSG